MTPKTKKNKQILILLGSPREDGNSTRLAFAFADAASAAGHAVQSIRVPALECAPCDACDRCRKTAAAAPCAIRDDMTSVVPLLRAADLIVFATPVHFGTWSPSIAALVSRLYLLSPCRPRNLSGKTTVLMATAANPSPSAFAGLRATYRLNAAFMGWTSLGEILIPGVAAEGDIATIPGALAKAARLAAKI